MGTSLRRFKSQTYCRRPNLRSQRRPKNPVPRLGQRYAIGSCVYVKRSNGQETLGYVNACDAEEAFYMVEIDALGSGKTEKCHDKDLRAATMLEGLIGSARASLFASN